MNRAKTGTNNSQYEALRTSKSLPNLPLISESKATFDNDAMRVASSNSVQILELFNLVGVKDQVQGYDDPAGDETGGPDDD